MWLKQSIINQINILKTNAPTYGLYEDVSVHVLSNCKYNILIAFDG